jgi:hypothetical protein
MTKDEEIAALAMEFVVSAQQPKKKGQRFHPENQKRLARLIELAGGLGNAKIHLSEALETYKAFAGSTPIKQHPVLHDWIRPLASSELG